MARLKRPPTIVPWRWWPTLKSKFLDYSFEFYPSALKELAIQVRENKVTVRQWAESWEVADTWIEQWAEQTLTSWRKEPPVVDGYITYPSPTGTRAEEKFSFTITDAISDCRLAFGETVGGAKFGTNEPTDDWERFRDSLQRRLNYELKIYRIKMLRIGMLEEVDLGTDEELELNLKIAAVNVFGNKSAGEIGQYAGVARERSVVSRRVTKILALLDLKPTKRGRKRSLKGATI